MGAALAAASVAAATSILPVTPRPPGTPLLDQAVQLAAGDSILNVPFNLFQQLVNIPRTEVEALNSSARSLLFTGNWWTPSATNIWGEDPGDPGHFMGLTNLMIPFKAISGLGSPEIDPDAAAAGTAGLGQQLALLAAAELPASASCDATWCAPVVPTSPITGFTGIDQTIWFAAALTGTQPVPLFNGWFQVPLSDLTSGYTFPTVVSPSAGVGAGGSVPDGFGFAGTVDGPNGENLMPWSGLHFTLNPLGPFHNFYNSLLAPPSVGGFEILDLEELGRAVQAVAAGTVVDFYPFVPGSPACAGACDLPDWLTTAGIIRGIDSFWPGNTLIQQWLTLNEAGLANAATPDQIDFATEFLQQGGFDLGNPLPSDPVNPEPFTVAAPIASLIELMQDSGVQGFAQALADGIGPAPADFGTLPLEALSSL